MIRVIGRLLKLMEPRAREVDVGGGCKLQYLDPSQSRYINNDGRWVLLTTESRVGDNDFVYDLKPELLWSDGRNMTPREKADVGRVLRTHFEKHGQTVLVSIN